MILCVQLTTSFARALAGSLPRAQHRDDLAPAMNPLAPLACEFLSESLREGFALGLGKSKDPTLYGEARSVARAEVGM